MAMNHTFLTHSKTDLESIVIEKSLAYRREKYETRTGTI